MLVGHRADKGFRDRRGCSDALLPSLIVALCCSGGCAIRLDAGQPPGPAVAPPAGPAAAELPVPESVLDLERAVVAAVARAERSVVAIARVRKDSLVARGAVVRSGQSATGLVLPQGNPTDPDFVPNEYATGVVIDDQGHIVTNYHVLGDPTQNDYYVWVQRRPFRVTRVEVPERVEAGDPWMDLAVLKVATTVGLEPIRMGDAAALRKGMFVIALGNPYAIARDGDVSATWGIVSNLHRSAPLAFAQRGNTERNSLHHFGTLIQTDVRLRHGTSGGALINLAGELVGLTTTLTPLPGYEDAAGFAIPVDDAFRQTVATLKEGRVPEYGFLGVEPEHLSLAQRQQGQFGTRILRVLPGTPAAAAGLELEDVITHVNGSPVEDKNALFRALSRLPAETTVALTVAHRDPLTQRVRTRTAEVVLAKKYTPSARRPYAQQPPPTWRGLQVEYPSALPPELRSLGLVASVSDPCVAVVQVERESPAWQAGLRPGQYISHVEGHRVTTPREFLAAVGQRERADVRLRVLAGAGETEERVVRP